MKVHENKSQKRLRNLVLLFYVVVLGFVGWYEYNAFRVYSIGRRCETASKLTSMSYAYSAVLVKYPFSVFTLDARESLEKYPVGTRNKGSGFLRKGEIYKRARWFDPFKHYLVPYSLGIFCLAISLLTFVWRLVTFKKVFRGFLMVLVVGFFVYLQAQYYGFLKVIPELKEPVQACENWLFENPISLFAIAYFLVFLIAVSKIPQVKKLENSEDENLDKEGE